MSRRKKRKAIDHLRKVRAEHIEDAARCFIDNDPEGCRYFERLAASVNYKILTLRRAQQCQQRQTSKEETKSKPFYQGLPAEL